MSDASIQDWKASPRNEGRLSELLFVSTAIEDGWDVKKSTDYQDAVEHWDYRIEKDGESLRVEVKGRKRIHREDRSYNDDFIPIEIVNCIGLPGWIYGEADVIAFHNGNRFIVAGRERIVGLLDAWLNDRFLPHPKPFFKYNVRNSMSVITLIYKEDALDASMFTWNAAGEIPPEARHVPINHPPGLESEIILEISSFTDSRLKYGKRLGFRQRYLFRNLRGKGYRNRDIKHALIDMKRRGFIHVKWANGIAYWLVARP